MDIQRDWENYFEKYSQSIDEDDDYYKNTRARALLREKDTYCKGKCKCCWENSFWMDSECAC